MKKTLVLIGLAAWALSSVYAQQQNVQQNQQQRRNEWKPESTEWYTPVPAKVTPGSNGSAPSDAIILFDGNFHNHPWIEEDWKWGLNWNLKT